MLFVSSLVLAEPKGVTYDTKIIRVIDGDTVVVPATYLPPPLKPELSVRIYGVDTPEKNPRAHCPSENEKAQAATEFTKKMVAGATTSRVTIYEWDKYGGRILGDIIINNKSLRAMLIQGDYAREYYGDAKKSWCE